MCRAREPSLAEESTAVDAAPSRIGHAKATSSNHAFGAEPEEESDEANMGEKEASTETEEPTIELHQATTQRLAAPLRPAILLPSNHIRTRRPSRCRSSRLSNSPKFTALASTSTSTRP